MDKKRMVKKLVERFADEIARLEIEYENIYAQTPDDEPLIQDEDLRILAAQCYARMEALRDMFEMLADDYGIAIDIDRLVSRIIAQYKRFIA